MKKYILISLLLFPLSVKAQQIISSAGSQIQGVSWTVGELFTATAVGEKYYAIQGFNHPVGQKLPSSMSQVKLNLEIKTYPNPVIDRLSIDSKKGSYLWKLSNLLGQKIFSGKSSKTNTSVDMTSLASGNYLLTVSTSSQTNSFIIIKK